MDKATQGGTYLLLPPPGGDAAWKEAQTKGRESAGLSFSLFLKAEIGTVEVKGIRTTVDAR